MVETAKTHANNTMHLVTERIARLACGSVHPKHHPSLALGTHPVLGGTQDCSGGCQRDCTEGSRRVTRSHSHTWMTGKNITNCTRAGKQVNRPHQGQGQGEASPVPVARNFKGSPVSGAGRCKAGPPCILLPWHLPYLTLVLAPCPLTRNTTPPQLHLPWLVL